MNHIEREELKKIIFEETLQMDLPNREYVLIAILDLEFGIPTKTTQVAAFLGLDQPTYYRRLGEAMVEFGRRLMQRPGIREWIDSVGLSGEITADGIVSRLLSFGRDDSEND